MGTWEMNQKAIAKADERQAIGPSHPTMDGSGVAIDLSGKNFEVEKIVENF
jgi:hypothetical protein